MGLRNGLWGSCTSGLPACLARRIPGSEPPVTAVPVLLLSLPQLQSGDFAVLKRLVPLLEELSRTYPEPLTQELATDLRIAICTHGAFSPGTVGAAADGVLGKKPGTGAQSPAGNPSGTPCPGGGWAPSRHGRSSPLAPRERSEEQSASHETGTAGPAPAPCADSPAPAGLQELLVSAYDCQPPGRAAALRRLSSLIMQRDPEALRLQEKILQVAGSRRSPCPVPQHRAGAERAGGLGQAGDGPYYRSPPTLLSPSAEGAGQEGPGLPPCAASPAQGCCRRRSPLLTGVPGERAA